jgi:cold shock CspA family protein
MRSTTSMRSSGGSFATCAVNASAAWDTGTPERLVADQLNYSAQEHVGIFASFWAIEYLKQDGKHNEWKGRINMSQQRYAGTLKKWKAERGYGFVTSDDGGQDILVHISAFGRNGRQPLVGEALSFEVEPDRNGKRCAVRVSRPGEPVREAPLQRPVRHRKSSRDNEPGFFGKLFTVFLVCAVALFAYSQYNKRAAKYDSILPAPPAFISPAKLTLPADFKCDGRYICSQMTSCREATLFQQNCPGMEMDGNGDGVPCEKQWCTK